MENLKNKQLTVYLSKNLETSEVVLEQIRKLLKLNNFIVTEYNPSQEYTLKNIQSCDFVLFVPPTNQLIRGDHKSWRTLVAKGQHNEAMYCFKNDKPAFMFHNKGYLCNDIMVSKLADKSSPFVHRIIDAFSWKLGYGQITSYVGYGGSGTETVSLFPLLEGFVYNNPLIPSECYQFNYKLLLLK